MKDLPNKLRIKATMIELGERIAWGSETALMHEAADKIEALEADLAKLQGEYEWVTSINDALDASNKEAWTELAALKAQEPVATVTIQHFRQDPSMENLEFQLQAPIPQGTHKLYASPVAQLKVVMPEQFPPLSTPERGWDKGYEDGWNACLDEFERLNGGQKDE